ncbi:MAG: hypothetical protein IKE68_05365, partial [Solobacterium sp.]|nr:hypothetical protein [Solobacterium sp.]
HVLTGNWQALYDEMRDFRAACGDAHVKAILATGDLKTLRNVRMVMARGRLIKDPKVSKYPECERELDKFID